MTCQSFSFYCSLVTAVAAEGIPPQRQPNHLVTRLSKTAQSVVDVGGSSAGCRQQAPVYYIEQYDFYALSPHEDVAPAFKDFETYSSAHGVDLATIRSGQPPEPPSIIFMDPPEHRRMRGLVNKVFTPRAIGAMEPMVIDVIDCFLSAVNPDRFDVVQDFSALFPVEVTTTMLGVPTEHRQQVHHWVDTSLHRDPGQLEMSEADREAATQTGLLYYNLIQERRAQPRGDMISKMISAEVERDDGN
jgi:cytochrome P450